MLRLKFLPLQKLKNGTSSASFVSITKSQTMIGISDSMASTPLKPLVIGNWKMNGSLQLIDDLAAGFGAARYPDIEVVILPPAVLAAQAVARLQHTQIKVGAQNVHRHISGAYTGEISAGMLAEAGCVFALTGHSERRHGCRETHAEVAHKYAAIIGSGLTPVLCVGETLDERKQGKAFDIIRTQIEAVLAVVGADLLQSGIIAYEPVWAIGTGLAASSLDANDMHRRIKDWLQTQTGKAGQQMPVLYGGSVNERNAAALFAEPAIDGALVGGAALDIAAFLKILSCLSAAKDSHGIT